MTPSSRLFPLVALYLPLHFETLLENKWDIVALEMMYQKNVVSGHIVS